MVLKIRPFIESIVHALVFYVKCIGTETISKLHPKVELFDSVTHRLGETDEDPFKYFSAKEDRLGVDRLCGKMAITVRAGENV